MQRQYNSSASRGEKPNHNATINAPLDMQRSAGAFVLLDALIPTNCSTNCTQVNNCSYWTKFRVPHRTFLFVYVQHLRDFRNYFFVSIILHLTSLNENQKKVYIKCFQFVVHAVVAELVYESIWSNQGKRDVCCLIYTFHCQVCDIRHCFNSQQGRINLPEHSVQQWAGHLLSEHWSCCEYHSLPAQSQSHLPAPLVSLRNTKKCVPETVEILTMCLCSCYYTGVVFDSIRFLESFQAEVLL